MVSLRALHELSYLAVGPDDYSLNFFTHCHTEIERETVTYVSAGHIILTPTQPLWDRNRTYTFWPGVARFTSELSLPLPACAEKWPFQIFPDGSIKNLKINWHTRHICGGKSFACCWGLSTLYDRYFVTSVPDFNVDENLIRKERSFVLWIPITGLPVTINISIPNLIIARTLTLTGLLNGGTIFLSPQFICASTSWIAVIEQLNSAWKMPVWIIHTIKMGGKVFAQRPFWPLY